MCPHNNHYIACPCVACHWCTKRCFELCHAPTSSQPVMEATQCPPFSDIHPMVSRGPQASRMMHVPGYAPLGRMLLVWGACADLYHSVAAHVLPPTSLYHQKPSAEACNRHCAAHCDDGGWMAFRSPSARRAFHPTTPVDCDALGRHAHQNATPPHHTCCATGHKSNKSTTKAAEPLRR